MFESLDIVGNISFIIVFFEGIFSFFSPCILPLIPVYITYLAGNAKKVLPDGTVIYNKKRTFLHTLCFTLGISCTFFLLGFSFSTLGQFFSNYQNIFTKIGGMIIIILGLFQVGIFDFKFLQKERKIKLDITKKPVNPLIAFVMGFTFSFAWTPCVGPALSSVLILASSARSTTISAVLILTYSIGFILPFLILGIFTSTTLNFFKKNQKIIKYTVKLSGVLLIIIGVMTFTGFLNGISSYLNSFVGNSQVITETTEKINNTENITETTGEIIEDTTEETTNAERELSMAYDFELEDQYGNIHKLSDYKDKVVFLNFWATWCGPCVIEMPHIEEIYKDYGLNEEDVIILGVSNPKTPEYPNNSDESKEKVIQFLDQNNYTFPTVFDETGEIYRNYGISAFPTTFMINKEGKVYGYVPGMLTKDNMKSIIEETLEN